MYLRINWYFFVRVFIIFIKLENEINEFVKYNYKNVIYMEVFIDLYIFIVILKFFIYVEYLRNCVVFERILVF